MRFSINGTDSHGNLTVEGKKAPFAIFDAKYQDWVFIGRDWAVCQALLILLNGV